MLRCPVCSRLIPEAREEKCPICGANNTQWRKLTSLDHFRRFPLSIRIAVGFVLVATLLLPAIVCLCGLSSQLSLTLIIAAILAVVLSATIIVAIYVFKFTLRNYEFLRRVRRKKRRPSLVTLAAFSIGVAIAFSLGTILLLWVAFTFAPDGEWTIRTRDFETGSYQSLLEEKARVLHPVWSPDGRTIVFASDRDGDWDIYAMNVEDSGLRNLTNNNAADYAPSWSYDGSRIAFASDRRGKWDIFFMDPDGRNPQPLTDEARRATDPAWSPDNRKIVFVVASPTFSALLGDQVGFMRKLSLAIAVLYGGFTPFLTLALMLIGVRCFTKRLDKEFPRPVYLNIDNLARVVLKAVRAQLQIRPEELQIISMSRTGSGGLSIVVSRQVKLEKRNEKTGEIMRVSEEKRYDVETDEWGYIRSLKSKLPGR